MPEPSARTHILCVVGARPNFMKIAPIMRAFAAPQNGIRATLVHTGQHYDAAMKRAFFEQLSIPEPDVDLGVGSGTHAEQTANIMLRFEPVLEAQQPDAVLVVGDVNSTIACALVAVKCGIPVIHVEAGLRSGDRSMPEEINRVLTDQLSELLFTTEQSAADNLSREGIPSSKVHFVGNVMIDTLLYNLPAATPARVTLNAALDALSGQGGEGAARAEALRGRFQEQWGLLTLHRPSNVDDAETLGRLLGVLVDISKHMPLLFPVHPRTAMRIEAMGYSHLVTQGNILMMSPQGYLEMLGLMREARVVFTDSGGIQEETTALGVPCITLRESTERPITVEQGTNAVVGTDPARIRSVCEAVLQGEGKAGRQPQLWDGTSADRIAAVISEMVGSWKS